MDIFVKNSPGPPVRPANVGPNQVWIDHETGLIHGLPEGPQPLVGPTTGSEYQQLKKKEREHKQAMHLLKRQMLSTYQCTQCKRKWSGKNVRLSWKLIDGVQAEVLKCPMSSCDAPVVLIEDALNLVKPPMGKI